MRKALEGDLDVACPLCRAPAGRPCVSTGGHGPMPGSVHRERAAKARTPIWQGGSGG